MNNASVSYSDWLKQAKSRQQAALTKLAADEEALTGIKDPANKGQVQIPSHPDGNNRSLLGLPENMDNMSGGEKPKLMSVTDPAGTGEGTYVTPRNGNARECAATSPTSPLDKIANDLNSSIAGLQSTAATPVAQQSFQMPGNIYQDSDLLQKLAAVGAVLMGSEEGQQAVAEVLEREAGIKEAAAILDNVNQSIAKQASAMNEEEQYQMIKLAADQAAHAAWLDSFESNIEKQAYAQGAADADAMAAQGPEDQAAIPGSDQLSDEDALQVLQELVASGEVRQEEAEALLQMIQGDGQPSMPIEQLAQELKMAVESGQIDPETAEVIAKSIMVDAGMVSPEEAGAIDQQAAAPAPAPGDVAAMAAQEGVNKAASVLNTLF